MPSPSAAQTPLPKGEALADRATSYWTTEARYGVKGRALLQRAGFPLYNLSVCFADSSPSRGASGETVHFAGTAKASPTRGNGDDRRQRRKQGVAVGAAASRMQATAQQTLGAATRPCLRSRLRGCTKTEPFLCRKVRLVASLPVSFCRSLWYTYFAPGARPLTPLLYL